MGVESFKASSPDKVGSRKALAVRTKVVAVRAAVRAKVAAVKMAAARA